LNRINRKLKENLVAALLRFEICGSFQFKDMIMEMPESFEFEWDGKIIAARRGQTIAEALLANGIRTFRRTVKRAPRGVYCNMGICYECRMIVDGRPNVRTCMTAVTPGCKVAIQNDAQIEVEGERG
jgi:sarcosine oxidase subunit alpha